jgi:hypothetical protein
VVVVVVVVAGGTAGSAEPEAGAAEGTVPCGMSSIV